MTRRQSLAAVAATLLCTVAGPATAGARFAAYEGPDAVRQGEGGTKVTKDGIDFWTSGSPPRAYRVIGELEDKRGSGLLHPDAVGSGSVAAQIKKVGGDGALVLSQDSQVVGGIVSNGMVGIARRNFTRFLVIKYVTE